MEDNVRRTIKLNMWHDLEFHSHVTGKRTAEFAKKWSCHIERGLSNSAKTKKHFDSYEHEVFLWSYLFGRFVESTAVNSLLDVLDRPAF